MAQVYGIAKQSGGGVGMETAPDAGTSVRVYLPRAAFDAVAIPAPDTEASETASGIARGRRILLVDGIRLYAR